MKKSFVMTKYINGKTLEKIAEILVTEGNELQKQGYAITDLSCSPCSIRFVCVKP